MRTRLRALKLVSLAGLPAAVALSAEAGFANSIGQQMVRIEPGTYVMGSRLGGRDEEPLHRVRISTAFHLSATEVTNVHYEQFAPGHRELRNKQGFSSRDDEAVVFVSWNEATAFCAWLAAKEERPYRLPTEAEWEYACRAGTESEFNTGATLPAVYHNNQQKSWFPDYARSKGQHDEVGPLRVGQTPANAWGLFDLHGNVEEWCSDWYGTYVAGDQVDPVGRVDGEFRVSRGGSHSAEIAYLRSANRSGSISEDKSWVIGFRVALGPPPTTPPLPVAARELYQQDVRQDVPATVLHGPDPANPYFGGPRNFVRIFPSPRGPFFPHNHVPSISELPNGDLLAIWFTTLREADRELHCVASRLRYGSAEWEPASESFFSPPDRNASVGILWWDGKRTVWHFNGLAAAATWGAQALIARVSVDNGVTWSKPRFVDPEHASRHVPIAAITRPHRGAVMFTTDIPGRVRPGNGGTAIWASTDGGQTFQDPGVGRPEPVFQPGESGAWIAGIHAPIVDTADGRGLVAMGRRDGVTDNLIRSVSYDLGKNWTYRASAIEPLGSGQRLTMLRLQDGSLFLASFTKGMELTDAAGHRRIVKGLYAALSFDDGVTWSHRRLVTDDGPARTVDGGALTHEFEFGPESAEPKGYLASIQARNGVIHLVSSGLHYEFNPAWLRVAMPAAPQ